MLKASERGALVWGPGGVEELDWGAPAAVWTWSLRCFGAAHDGVSGALALLTSGGLVHLPRQGGPPAFLAPARCTGPLALAPGGTRLAFLDPEGALVVRSPGELLFRCPLPAPALALAFGSDGLLAVSLAAPRSGTPSLWVLDPQGARLASVELTAPCSTLLFSSRGLLVAAHGRAVSFWTHDGLAAGSLEVQPGTPSALAEDPASARLAVGYRGGPVAMWNFPIHGGTGTYAGGVDGHRGTVRGLRFLAGGAGLASAGEDQAVVLWGLPGKQAQQRLSFGGRGIEAAAAEPGGRRWLLGHNDGGLSVLAGSHREREMGQHVGGVFSVAWSEDGTMVASGGADGRVCLWGSKRGDLKAEVKAEGAVQGLAFQGRALLVADERGLGRWAWAFAARLPAFGVVSGPLLSLARVALEGEGGCSAVVAHERIIAAARAEGRVLLGDPRGGWRAPITLGHPLWSLAFAPQGRLLACGGEGVVTICDARFAERLFRIEVPGGRLWSAAWSPDGQRLAVGCQDGEVRVISLESGRIVEELPGHTEEVTGVFWSRDGLFSAGRDGALVAWEQGPGGDCLLP